MERGDAGTAAVDAPLAGMPNRFPLILVSHGNGGSAAQMAWLGTVLAQAAFVTTPDQMFDVLSRTVADRSVGLVFFGNYYLMDYELMGGDGRKAIEAEDKKYGIPGRYT